MYMYKIVNKTVRSWEVWFRCYRGGRDYSFAVLAGWTVMEVGNAACFGTVQVSSHLGDQHCESGVRFGTVFDHFAELEETCSLIDDLPRICRDFIALEASQERFTRKTPLPNYTNDFLLFFFKKIYA